MSNETEYPDNSDNVLAFTKRFNENADIKEMLNVSKAKKGEVYCHHELIEINEHQRSVTCRRCKAVVDPFDWINSVAKKEANIAWELTSLRREIKSHREGLEKLKREETNCKARIRTAKAKLGADI
ncbi:hypothetical protein I2492_05955 [Budviciaceae bacterium CWB-B4]|uniref:Uncharacterized protein n=1 Tax=Limnobaculum xujianqingii TaxID=2738837 RepID=A0A9D7AH10_9GAMM|nr:hypothetical protein [Limnobaculum xujianqingii]MBK5072552.1 hypothetical protein [Limnobaculum xujianqingii]MBK5175861.1 hypothetical protein [Limnobaculum xujianqingii]